MGTYPQIEVQASWSEILIEIILQKGWAHIKIRKQNKDGVVLPSDFKIQLPHQRGDEWLSMQGLYEHMGLEGLAGDLGVVLDTMYMNSIYWTRFTETDIEVLEKTARRFFPSESEAA